MKTEIGKGMWASHQITAFLDLGKEKALTGFPSTQVWFYLINRMYCPWMIFSDAGRHYALSSLFDSLHYSTYCLGRLATLYDIVRQLSGIESCQAGYQGLSLGRNKHSIQDKLLGNRRKPLSGKKLIVKG